MTAEELTARALALVREATQSVLSGPPKREAVEAQVREALEGKALGWGESVDIAFRWDEAVVTLVPHNLFTGLLLAHIPAADAARYLGAEEAEIGHMTYHFYDDKFTIQQTTPFEQITVAYDFGADFDG